MQPQAPGRGVSVWERQEKDPFLVPAAAEAAPGDCVSVRPSRLPAASRNDHGGLLAWGVRALAAAAQHPEIRLSPSAPLLPSAPQPRPRPRAFPSTSALRASSSRCGTAQGCGIFQGARPPPFPPCRAGGRVSAPVKCHPPRSALRPRDTPRCLGRAGPPVPHTTDSPCFPLFSPNYCCRNFSDTNVERIAVSGHRPTIWIPRVTCSHCLPYPVSTRPSLPGSGLASILLLGASPCKPQASRRRTSEHCSAQRAVNYSSAFAA